MTVPASQNAITRWKGLLRMPALPLRLRVGRHTLKSLASISLWELTNNLLPLVTFPYLARVIGVDGFGIIGFSSAVAGYAGLIVEWGFPLSATQSIAIARDDPARVRQIVWDVLLAKIGLAALIGGLMVAVVLLFVHEPVLRDVLLVFAVFVFVCSLTIDWALRGTEKLGKLATAAIISRVSYVPLVFLLVREPKDVVWAAVALVAERVIFVVTSWWMALRLGLVGPPRVSVQRSLEQLRLGVHVFLSEITMPVYNVAGFALLGTLSTTYQTGLYAGVHKIRSAVQRGLTPLTVVFYPRINYLAGTDPEKMKKTILNVLLAQAGLGFCLSAGMCLAAGPLVRILLGATFEEAIPVARIAAWVIFPLALSGCFGQLILLPLVMKREYTLSICTGLIAAVLLAAPLVYFWGAIGAATALVISESTVAVAGFLIVVWRVAWFPNDITSAWSRNRQRNEQPMPPEAPL